MVFGEMMQFMSRVNNQLFGLRVVTCVQSKVTSFLSYFEKAMTAMTPLVEVGMSVKTTVEESIVASIPKSIFDRIQDHLVTSVDNVKAAVGKVDTIAHGIKIPSVNTTSPKQILETAKDTVTSCGSATVNLVASNPLAKLVFKFGDAGLCVSPQSIKLSRESENSTDKNSGDLDHTTSLNNNTVMSLDNNKTVPADLLEATPKPILEVAKDTASSYRAATFNLVSKLSLAKAMHKEGNSGEQTSKPYEKTEESTQLYKNKRDHNINSIISNKVNIKEAETSELKNKLMEAFTFGLILFVAILYVALQKFLVRMMLVVKIVAQKVFMKMNLATEKLIGWMLLNRIYMAVTLLTLVNIVLLLDSTILLYHNPLYLIYTLTDMN